MRNDLSKLMNKGSLRKSRERRPKGYKRAQQRLDHDEMPQRENSNRVWGWQKREKDRRFAPLTRYLESQVGRPFDDVYSDICRDVRFGDYHDYQLRQWVGYMVEQNVVIIDGEPHESRGMALGFWGDFWVHPDTGLLMKRHRKRHRSHRRDDRLKPVDLGENRRAVNIDGIWYEIILEEIPYCSRNDIYARGVFDLVLRERVYRIADTWSEGVSQSVMLWGGPFYAVRKLQLSKKRITQLGLPS